MAGYELGHCYRAGKHGVRIVFFGGTVLQLPPFAMTILDRQPRKVEGRLHRVGRRGALHHEAPAFEPAEVKG